jgi:hypothetical protein
MALLTITQQNSIKPISPNWANKVLITGGVSNFVQLQKEVENKEFKKLLGPAFLLDIQTNPATPANVILLEGTTFEDCDDNDIEFEGIEFQLAYMNYSKYVRISPIAHTFTGLQRQNRPETAPISEGGIKGEQHDARGIALQDFEIMKLYLNDNTDIYPLWKNGRTKKIYTPKLMTIRKTFN